MLNTLLRWMTELTSRKTIAHLLGRLAQSGISKSWIRRFADMYGINVEEAEKPVDEYRSLNEFFTRRLKQGLRTIEGQEHDLISPVDAVITGMGDIAEGRLINVKGQDYTVEELLNRSPRTINYLHGHYFVLYLSPSDYHRIHAPISGTIVEKERVSGKVYPVNAFGLQHMRKVLSRNERLITYIRHQTGEVAVVKVGAMNVGSIRYTEPLPDKIKRGKELAYFEFGSTVVLLTENDTFFVKAGIKLGNKIQMGQRLGTMYQRR